MNFISQILNIGGQIFPLIVNKTAYHGTGQFNPSIYYDDNEGLLINIRHCQYSLFHSEKGIFEHPYGPLVYLNPENDISLTTKNYFGKINSSTCSLDFVSEIDTSLLDQKPLWTFVGLEDARIVKWENKLYLSGVRRDTTTNGQGRMELSEIILDKDQYKEVARFRIPAPGKDDSYCEKNWMPVLDLPFHFVKWSNPTEVVRVDIEEQKCETVFLDNQPPKHIDFRGGSQVISFDNFRIACVHSTFLYKSEAGRKNAKYQHSFIVWDKDWNIIKTTPLFSFLNFDIEFCCGMTATDNDIYISFGIQDNAAYIIKMPKQFLREYIFNNG